MTTWDYIQKCRPEPGRPDPEGEPLTVEAYEFRREFTSELSPHRDLDRLRSYEPPPRSRP